MIPKGTGSLGKGGIIGNQRASLAIGAQIFPGVKAENCHLAESAGVPAAILGSVRLSGVFDESEFLLANDSQQRIEIGWQAIKMNWNDGLGSASNSAFNQVWIRSEEHTSELQSHSFISYAVFC